MNHQWYLDKDSRPKSHRRPHTCEHCRDNPKGACLLPFRSSRKVRWLAKLNNKPVYGFWKIRRNFGGVK